jgi:hypothetical protein
MTSAGFIADGQNLIIFATAEMAFSVAEILVSDLASGLLTICVSLGIASLHTSKYKNIFSITF